MSIIKCDECGSEDVIRAGKQWRVLSKNPSHRIRVQSYRCKHCGKIFVPKEINKEDTNGNG